jgi:recombination associated protein RdgC
MKLIRNAIIYNAEIPDAEILAQHLAEKPFSPPTPTALDSAGFVPVPGSDTDELVSTFQGGFAFSLRHDSKIVPTSAVKERTEDLVAKFKDHTGVTPGKKMRKELKEQALMELLPHALVRTAVVTCFYEPATKFLIVATGSQKLADTAMSRLVHAVGSVKTSTIHVSNVKGGLTARLKAWLEEDPNVSSEAFGPELQLGGAVALDRLLDRREKVAFSLQSLGNVPEGLKEALAKGFEVTSMAMVHGLVDFTLTNAFRFKGIEFGASDVAADLADANIWQHEAAIQVKQMSAVVQAMCDLLGYKPPETDGNPEGMTDPE